MARFCFRGIALCIVIAACSPLYRATTHRCPSTATLATDFVLATVGLGLAADRYNAGNTAASLTSFGAGMSVALAANMSECRR